MGQIGRAIVERFARDGAAVVIGDVAGARQGGGRIAATGARAAPSAVTWRYLGPAILQGHGSERAASLGAESTRPGEQCGALRLAEADEFHE